MKYYSYIFVRQDMSTEHQVVQCGHVCMQMGFEYNLGEFDKWGGLPSNVHFVVVGIRNEKSLEAVEQILYKFDYEYETFMDDTPFGKIQATAVATHPIPEDKRGPLLAFNLLKHG